MRAFADVDTIGGLTPVEALLELKRRFEGLITLEVVAFPQEGIIRDPGCDRLMEQAMDLGCDIVGGLPLYERLDRHVHEHIDFCFELAQHRFPAFQILGHRIQRRISAEIQVALRRLAAMALGAVGVEKWSNRVRKTAIKLANRRCGLRLSAGLGLVLHQQEISNQHQAKERTRHTDQNAGSHHCYHLEKKWRELSRLKLFPPHETIKTKMKRQGI